MTPLLTHWSYWSLALSNLQVSLHFWSNLIECLETKFLNAFWWLKIYDSRLKFPQYWLVRLQLKVNHNGSHNDLVPNNWQATIKDQMKAQLTGAYMFHSASLSFHQTIERKQLREYYSYTRIYVQPSNIMYIKVFIYLRIHIYIWKIGIFVYVYMHA